MMALRRVRPRIRFEAREKGRQGIHDRCRIERLADDAGRGLEDFTRLALGSLAATALATAVTVFTPALPVKALALPELTTRRGRCRP